MIRLVIVDDHPLVRAGLRALVESDDDIEVVGEAADGEAAVAVAVQTAPDVVLMDLSMPGVDGVAATRLIRRSVPGCVVVVLTSFPDRTRVKAAIAAGATGYLLKDSEPGVLVSGIRAAANGDAPLDPRVARGLIDVLVTGEPQDSRPPQPAASPAKEPVGLSAREQEVLVLTARGLANKQIAHVLGISEGTVKAHLGNVFRLIGVTDRTSAAMWARDHGVV